jgi:hypothetical protein
MNTEQREVFVNDLVLKNIKLTPEEIKYLIPQNRDKYVSGIMKTSSWIEDYEFDVLTNEEKKIYINRRRYLDKSILKNVDLEVLKAYINKVIISKAHFTPEEFDRIPSDELKSFYVKKKTKILMDTKLTPRELEFLDDDEQIDYLENLRKMGFAPNPEEFASFKPKAIRFHQTQKALNEMKSIIKNVL